MTNRLYGYTCNIIFGKTQAYNDPVLLDLFQEVVQLAESFETGTVTDRVRRAYLQLTNDIPLGK